MIIAKVLPVLIPAIHHNDIANCQSSPRPIYGVPARAPTLSRLGSPNPSQWELDPSVHDSELLYWVGIARQKLWLSTFFPPYTAPLFHTDERSPLGSPGHPWLTPRPTISHKLDFISHFIRSRSLESLLAAWTLRIIPGPQTRARAHAYAHNKQERRIKRVHDWIT